jgi:hypothetical protein
MPEDRAFSKKRQSVSVHNTVERLSKRPSVFTKYPRVLALAEGQGTMFKIPPQRSSRGDQRNRRRREMRRSSKSRRQRI